MTADRAEPAGVERWSDLVRFATLLTGDIGEAEAVVRGALVRAETWRPLHRGRDHAGGLPAVVVRLQLSRWRGGGVDLDAAPAPEVSSYDEDPGAAGRGTQPALRALPPRQRAALLLRYLDRSSDAGIAAAIGGSGESAARQVLAAVASLRRNVAGLTEPEEDIPHLLAAAAASIPVPDVPPDAAAITRAARTRQLLAGAAALVLLVAIAAGIGSLAGSPSHPTAAAAPAPRPLPASSANRHPPVIRTWKTGHGTVTAVGYATAVASGFDALWLGEEGYLRETAVDGDHATRDFSAGGTIADIRVGLGRVWLLVEQHGVDDQIKTLDPVTHRFATATVTGLPATFNGSVFWQGSLWLPIPGQGTIMQLTPAGDRLGTSVISTTGTTGHLAQRIFGSDGADQILGQVATPGLGRDALWVSSGTGQIAAIATGKNPATDPEAVRALLQAPGHGIQVVSGKTGVFAATDEGVLFFSNRGLRDGHPTPTAFFRDPHQSADFDAGQWGPAHIATLGVAVVINDGDGQTWVWRPLAT